VINERANTLGLYPNSAAALRTSSFVFLEDEAPGVKTLETADWLTPANFATSIDVIF
jgi:hypothetical protein